MQDRTTGLVGTAAHPTLALNKSTVAKYQSQVLVLKELVSEQRERIEQSEQRRPSPVCAAPTQLPSPVEHPSAERAAAVCASAGRAAVRMPMPAANSAACAAPCVLSACVVERQLKRALSRNAAGPPTANAQAPTPVPLPSATASRPGEVHATELHRVPALPAAAARPVAPIVGLTTGFKGKPNASVSPADQASGTESDTEMVGAPETPVRLHSIRPSTKPQSAQSTYEPQSGFPEYLVYSEP